MLDTGGNNSFLFSKHSDVLTSTPTDEISKKNLVDELKSRGNHAFNNKQYEEAEILYGKAIEFDPETVALYGNRSATRCSMGKLEEALEDANSAVKIDPQWTKGYFRQGQALSKLKRHAEAYNSFKNALEKDPNNPQCKKLMMEAKALSEINVGESKNANTTASVKKTESMKAGPKPSSKSSISKESSKSKNDSDDEAHHDDLKNVRGYKKLSDGRVTTYFNNELTEEERNLIGDIAPKKIEDANNAKIENVDGGSAWNSGSTFEEKDMSEWAKIHIKDMFGKLEYNFDDGTIVVESVENLDGDASIAVFRGKKRYIFAFHFELTCKWEETGVKGKIKYLDFSSDTDGDCDVDIIVPNRYENQDSKKLHEILSKKSGGFQSALRKITEKFIQEYHDYA